MIKHSMRFKRTADYDISTPMKRTFVLHNGVCNTE